MNSIRIVLASEIKLASGKLNLFLDGVKLDYEQHKNYVVFSNKKLENVIGLLNTVPIITLNVQKYREWLWKHHNEARLTGREVRNLAKEYPQTFEYYKANYFPILSVARDFRTCDSPTIIINSSYARPVAEVLVNYINYLNSLDP